MTECGIVLERREDGRLVVEVDRVSACDGCHAKGACSMGFGHKKVRVTARDMVGAEVGQRVALELQDKAFLAACAWVYLVPLAGLFLGAGLAWMLFNQANLESWREVGSALAALVGTAMGLAVVWLYDRQVRAARNWQLSRFELQARAISGK